MMYLQWIPALPVMHRKNPYDVISPPPSAEPVAHRIAMGEKSHWTIFIKFRMVTPARFHP